MFSLFGQGFSPHGICLLWQPALLWLHAASDIATGIAYFVIPIGLASLVVKRRELRFGWIFWLFALFILACGTTHFMDVWVLWNPDYAIQGLIKAFTAIASIVTAALLWKILPELATLPTPDEFRAVAEQLTVETVRHENTTEQLRQTEKTFKLMVESVSDCALYMLDPHGHVSFWNLGAQAINQYTAAEIIGQHFSCFYTAEDQAAQRPKYILEAAARTGSVQMERVCVRKDGTTFVADCTINRILDQNNVLVGFFKVTRDITQRRRAEQELKKAQAALAQSQKMEAVGQLTGGIAHDFNNMLTAILGSLELLDIRQETFSQSSNRMLQVIRHAAEHGAELTRRLLAFSRKQTLAPVMTDVNQLVSGMSELLRRMLGESIAIETVLRDDLWPTFVDRNQVESALVNLAVNARDAMTTGGKLTIQTGKAWLEADSNGRHGGLVAGDYTFISVTDTGSGMTAEVLEHAFEPFYTTKETGRGTGLGLSQVYGFVRQSGGHVELSSRVGHGTTVKMYFPRPDLGNAAVTPTSARTTAPLVGGTETILMVDDDVDVRSYSANAARHLGYNVLEAANATAAQAILANRPDIRLLFTDIGLPGTSGSELASRASQARPDLRIVLTSGYARNVFAEPQLISDAIPFLAKPFRIEGLAQVLRATLDAEYARSNTGRTIG